MSLRVAAAGRARSAVPPQRIFLIRDRRHGKTRIVPALATPSMLTYETTARQLM